MKSNSCIHNENGKLKNKREKNQRNETVHFLNCSENHCDWRERTIKSFVIERVEIKMNVQHAAYNAYS